MSPRRQGLAVGALLLLAAAALADSELACRVTYVASGGLYVDAGTQQGLRKGDVGIVRRNGAEIARAEVVAAAATSARLRVLGGASTEPAVGDSVHFAVRPAREETAAEEPRAPEDQQEFVPLLERQGLLPKSRGARNISHGRVSLTEFIQLDQEDSLDYTTTILGTSGMWDRISGSPWAFRWAANFSARSGSAFEGSPLEGARADIYELSLRRPLDGKGFLKLGRFLPTQLSSIGYLDGVQAEIARGTGLRLGGVAGFKPTRSDLDPTTDEPMVAGYVTVVRGTGGRSLYSGTFGVLSSWFQGDHDRAALLLDQYLELGRNIRTELAAQIDFDVGAGLASSGPRLTQLNYYLEGRLNESLLVSAGTDHHERLDNRAERSIVDFPDADPATFAFWRYWVGFDARLGAKLDLDGELAFIDAIDADFTPHWWLTLTRYDPFMPGSDIALTVYNLDGAGLDGVGGLLSTRLLMRRWSLQAALGFSTADSAAGDLSVTEVRLHADYQVSSRWLLQGSFSHFFGDGLDSTLLQLGLTYRW